MRKYVAKYEEIASALAAAIVSGEYKVGEKLYGRSMLAVQFKVSPETVRRAISLLQSQAVVASVPGSGVVILSKEAAKKFLDDFFTLDVIEKKRRLQELIHQRNLLNKEIDELFLAIAQEQEQAFLRKYNLREIRVEAGSILDGQSVQSAKIHSLTGATVVAIKRDDQCIYAPSRTVEVKAGDVIVFVGSREAERKLMTMVSCSKLYNDGE